MHVDPGGGLQVSNKASSRSRPESTAVGVHNAKRPGLLIDHFGDPGRANGRGVCVCVCFYPIQYERAPL